MMSKSMMTMMSVAYASDVSVDAQGRTFDEEGRLLQIAQGPVGGAPVTPTPAGGAQPTGGVTQTPVGQNPAGDVSSKPAGGAGPTSAPAAGSQAVGGSTGAGSGSAAAGGADGWEALLSLKNLPQAADKKEAMEKSASGCITNKAGITAAASSVGLPASLIAAMLSRETNCMRGAGLFLKKGGYLKEITPSITDAELTGWGDASPECLPKGCAYGAMQIDYRYHADITGPQGSTPKNGPMSAGYLSAAMGIFMETFKKVPASAASPLKYRCAISGWNRETMATTCPSNPDSATENGDYSADVVNRMIFFKSKGF